MGASLLIFLNKIDVDGCMTEDEVRQVGLLLHWNTSFFWMHIRIPFTYEIHIVQRLRLDAIKTHKWTILPCSAMTGKNLHEGLDWVVQDAKDRLFLY